MEGNRMKIKDFGTLYNHFYLITEIDDYLSLWVIDCIPDDFSNNGIEKFMMEHELEGSSLTGESYSEIVIEINNFIRENIINFLVERCDRYLSNPGYQDYIKENLGEALDVMKHNGSMIDLDNIVHLKDILSINVSYEMYSYIDGNYDCSLLEINDKAELFSILSNYIN